MIIEKRIIDWQNVLNLQNNINVTKNGVMQKFENIIEIILLSLNQNNFEKTFNLIKKDLWDVRIDLLGIEKDNIKKSLTNNIIKQTTDNYMFANKYSKLLNNILEIYFEIVKSVNFENAQMVKYEFRNLEVLKKLLPNDEKIIYLNNYIETSLYLDYCLMLVQFVINKEITLTTEQETELLNQLENTFVEYAANAWLLDIVEFDETESNPLYMKIIMRGTIIHGNNQKYENAYLFEGDEFEIFSQALIDGKEIDFSKIKRVSNI